MERDFSERTYVVTGATSGIGLATAECLVRQGAWLIGVGRSAERCRKVENHLSRLNGHAHVNMLRADLSEQDEVHRLADEIHTLLDAQGNAVLDGLVNNAAVFTYWMSLTSGGFEMQWAVNHLAPFLLTNRLLPLLQAAPFARVVTVSSDSHRHSRLDWNDPQLRRHYHGLRAYGNTKLANILFTLELNRQLGELSSVRAFAADPGLVRTDIGMKGTPSFAGLAWRLRRSGGIPPQEAAEGIVYLLTEPSIQHAEQIYWKHGKPVRASKVALNYGNAVRLWQLSQKMCAIHTEVRHAAV